MSPTCTFKKKVTPLQNIVKRKRRFIRCSSYVVARRPAIIKDVLIRGTINTTAAFAIYVSEQQDLPGLNMGVIEGFFTESFEVQVTAMLLHLIYDIYHEYKACEQDTEACMVSYDNGSGDGDGGSATHGHIPSS